MTLKRTRYSSINPLFTKLTLIRYRIGNDQRIATGFFYKYNPGLEHFYDDKYPSHSQTYLVTNKHVLVENENIAEDFRIYLRNRGDPTECTSHEMELIDNTGGKNWLEHPSNEDADLAVIKMDLDLKNTRNLSFNRDSVGGPRVTSGGDEALVLGYPFRAGTIDQFPVIRSTTISSPYSIDSEARSFFLIDSRMHDGMSGSPVVAKPETHLGADNISVDIDNPEFPHDVRVDVDNPTNKPDYPHLLGVHSETLYPPYDGEVPQSASTRDSTTLDLEQDIEIRLDELERKLEEQGLRIETLEDRLDLNKVWHAKLIDEIIESSFG